MRLFKVNNRTLIKINGRNIDSVCAISATSGLMPDISTYTYITGTLPAQISSLTCYRLSSEYGHGSTGILPSGSTIYYGDYLYWEVVATSGYTAYVTHDINSPIFVYKPIVGVDFAGIISDIFQYIYTRGTLPSHISSLSCYRDSSLTEASIGLISDGSTIYYGDTLHWTANADTGYKALLNYTSTSSYLVNSNVIGIQTTNVRAERLTWSYNIYIGSGVTSYRYKINSGSWVTMSENKFFTNLDYADVVTIEIVSVAEGYQLDTTAITKSYANDGGSINLSAQRLTWTASITKNNYMQTVSYTINGGTSYDVGSTINLTLDYSDVLVVSGIRQSEEGYTYGNITGTGTFNYQSYVDNNYQRVPIVVACTRTRITWTASITLGTGVKNYIYSTDNGSTWSSATTATTVSEIDYADSFVVKANEANTGYKVTSNTALATYSLQSVTVPDAERLTWTLSITKGNYVSAVSYKINGSSSVSVIETTSLNLDYSDYVVVSGIAESEVPYNYGPVTGIGTFNYQSYVDNNYQRVPIVVACTRSVKSYTYTQGTLPTGCASLTCYRESSPYQHADPGIILDGSTIYYEDTLYWTTTAETNYEVSVTHDSSSTVTVYDNIIGVNSAGISVVVTNWSITINVLDDDFGQFESISYVNCNLNGSLYSRLSRGDSITISNLSKTDSVSTVAYIHSSDYWNYSVHNTGTYTNTAVTQNVSIYATRSVAQLTYLTEGTGGVGGATLASQRLSSVTCYRVASPYAGASLGIVNNGEIVYGGDELRFTGTPASGYRLFGTSYEYNVQEATSYKVTKDYYNRVVGAEEAGGYDYKIKLVNNTNTSYLGSFPHSDGYSWLYPDYYWYYAGAYDGYRTRNSINTAYIYIYKSPSLSSDASLEFYVDYAGSDWTNSININSVDNDNTYIFDLNEINYNLSKEYSYVGDFSGTISAYDIPGVTSIINNTKYSFKTWNAVNTFGRYAMTTTDKTYKYSVGVEASSYSGSTTGRFMVYWRYTNNPVQYSLNITSQSA